MRQSLVSWFACIPHRQRAAEFESELEKSEDIVIRTRLLGYYTALKKPTEADVDRQIEHLKILISLVPEESFLAVPLDPSSAKYALIATEWRDQARAHGDSAEVISNAALFLARSDLDEACRLLENAIHLEPHVWTWRFHLGRILQQGDRRCNFCGKGEGHVQRLIAGGGKQPTGDLPVVFICDECVELCHAIIDRKPDKSAPARWSVVDDGDEEFEWTPVPQPDGSTLIVVRRSGSEKSVGGVLPKGTSITTDRIREIIQTLRDRL